MSGTSGAMPVCTVLAPLATLAFIAADMPVLSQPLAQWLLLPAATLLSASIFTAVHHAETIVHRVGQPFGSIILALVVTVGPHLVIGPEAEQMVLLLLSRFVAIVSVTTGRTTSLQGGVHLVNFGAFMTLSAVP